MKTKSERLDNNANLIEYVANKYLYEIVEAATYRRGTRGLVLVQSPAMTVCFVSKSDLLAASIYSNRPLTIEGIIKAVSEYDMEKELVLLITDKESSDVEAMAIIGIMWQTINLKGE